MEKDNCLYIVATPIGNLGDISYRAVEVLKSVDLILAEDTRQSQKLMHHYTISTPLKAYHQHNEHHKTQEYIDQIIAGKSIAVVSDAGTPGISDPGFLIVREAIKNNISIISIPGPAAFLTALVASGLPLEKFSYEGFLPPKKGRKTKLEEITMSTKTIVFYESPHKLIKTLTSLTELLAPERQIVVARELTKIFEEFIRGSAHEVLEHFTTHKPKGEFVVLVEPVK